MAGIGNPVGQSAGILPEYHKKLFNADRATTMTENDANSPMTTITHNSTTITEYNNDATRKTTVPTNSCQ